MHQNISHHEVEIFSFFSCAWTTVTFCGTSPKWKNNMKFKILSNRPNLLTWTQSNFSRDLSFYSLSKQSSIYQKKNCWGNIFLLLLFKIKLNRSQYKPALPHEDWKSWKYCIVVLFLCYSHETLIFPNSENSCKCSSLTCTLASKFKGKLSLVEYLFTDVKK